MSARGKSTSGQIIPKVPRIRNIADIKGPLRERTLLHFTAEQWKQATAELREGKAVPKFGAGLECYPIPDGGVIAQPNCIEGPCEICRQRTGPGREGQVVIIDCQCQQDPNCPEDPPPPLPSPLCRLAIRATPPIRIYCEGNGCPRNCRLGFVRDGWRWLIICQC